MGIPSFYKHLLQTVGGLTAKERANPQVFALDLNCAIYHCARKRVQMTYTKDNHDAWEAALIQDVLVYITELTRRVKPTEIVYVAVDGVAPMAKIKQQRARRFKSAVLAAEEAAVRSSAAGTTDCSDRPDEIPPRWDSNAITPGTAFMAKLTAALHSDQLQRAFGSGGPTVICSPADEAGEGEQKIMAFLRKRADLRHVVVYGLDADLIVLALQEHGRTGRTVDLFREETEFGGGVKMSNTGSEECLYLLVSHLATVMHEKWALQIPNISLSEFLGDFVGLMNLLGNDFVPHGMALKIHDEGVEHVLEAWQAARRRGLPPLVTRDGTYSAATLAAIIATLVTQEERWLLRGVRNKLEARSGSKGDAVDRAVARMNDRPVEWAVERCLAELKQVRGEERPKWFLRQEWRRQYAKAALWDADVGAVARTYCQALTWTLRYYHGEPVDPTWYFPWLLPPLFEDVFAELGKNPACLTPPPPTAVDPLKPLEQLAMVLPVTSFHLLPPELQGLPARYPWAWPIRWDYFSLGRRFLWECEPLIPLIQPAQIRRWVEDCRDMA